MTTDFRALCACMAAELDHYRQLLMDDRREVHALATEARAALAEPEPEEPTDEAWLEFIEQLRRVQDVAQCEGMGPRFDLVEFAMQAWRGRTRATTHRSGGDFDG